MTHQTKHSLCRVVSCNTCLLVYKWAVRGNTVTQCFASCVKSDSQKEKNNEQVPKVIRKSNGSNYGAPVVSKYSDSLCMEHMLSDYFETTDAPQPEPLDPPTTPGTWSKLLPHSDGL